jgi:hypothetical protein
VAKSAVSLCGNTGNEWPLRFGIAASLVQTPSLFMPIKETWWPLWVRASATERAESNEIECSLLWPPASTATFTTKTLWR